VLPGGFFLDRIALEFSDCPQPTVSFPENLRCIGYTNAWLALDFMDDKKRHIYFLHNPFSKATVPLPKLDAVIGDASEIFRFHKVLMRSTPDDLISVMTSNWNCPMIFVLPNKGVWLPKPKTAPFVSIIDVAFLGDKLYGITKDEDLVSLTSPLMFTTLLGLLQSGSYGVTSMMHMQMQQTTMRTSKIITTYLAKKVWIRHGHLGTA
jgi:hypothetical protein